MLVFLENQINSFRIDFCPVRNFVFRSWRFVDQIVANNIGILGAMERNLLPAEMSLFYHYVDYYQKETTIIIIRQGVIEILNVVRKSCENVIISFID